MLLYWKFLKMLPPRELVSINNSACRWTRGVQNTYHGELKLCKQGFHASERIYQAARSCAGDVIARVEVGGTFFSGEDKIVAREMKVRNYWYIDYHDLVDVVHTVADSFVLPHEIVYQGAINKRLPVIIPGPLTINVQRYRFLAKLYEKLQGRNPYDVLSDIAIADPTYITKFGMNLQGVMERAFLDHIVSGSNKGHTFTEWKVIE